jgi:Glycine zipper
MAAKNKKKTTPARENEPDALKRNHVYGTTVGALGGELAGGIVGALAGPPGVVAGMLIGAAAGALAGHALDNDAEREREADDALDESIGVTSGDLGAPNLKHPPAKRGTFSAASMGVPGQADRTPVEGPISGADDE